LIATLSPGGNTDSPEVPTAAERVSQPNYQRWETGTASIPEDKLEKLAEALQVGADALVGRHPPVKAALYERGRNGPDI
jgi:transcriptional regulator with XRE-family HTH domain